jgi:hypothetical protein
MSIYLITAYKSGKRVEVKHPKRMNYDMTIASAHNLIKTGCDKVELLSCTTFGSKIIKTLMK